MKIIQIIERESTDDYTITTQEISDEQYAQFQSEGCSVRGSLANVMAEVFGETPRHTVELMNICDMKRRLDLYNTVNSVDKHMLLLCDLMSLIDSSMKKPQ